MTPPGKAHFNNVKNAFYTDYSFLFSVVSARLCPRGPLFLLVYVFMHSVLRVAKLTYLFSSVK